jgi:hypothetical protein
MLLNKFACPHCEAVLNSPSGVQAGKKIVCPKCREPFVVAALGAVRKKPLADDEEAEEERVQASRPPARAAKRAARPPEDDDERNGQDEEVEDRDNEEAAPRPKKRKKGKRKAAPNLVLVWIIGGSVLLAGGGVALYFVFRKAPPTDSSADASKMPDTPADKRPPDGAPNKSGPRYSLGKETTYVTGPLDKQGYIDYEAALNDELGKGITADRNANVLIWQAIGPTPAGAKEMPPAFFKRLGIESPPKSGAYFVTIGEYSRDHLKRDPGAFDTFLDQRNRAGQRPWSAQDYPDVAAWLKANEKPLELIVEATRRPDYFNPLVCPRSDESPGSLWSSPIPSMEICRDAAGALTARAMLRVAEGTFDEGWEDLRACHRLAQLVGRGGCLMEGLVGVAIDLVAYKADLAYLERANLTPVQTRERLKSIQDLPPIPSLADKVERCERFAYLETLQHIARRGPGVLEGLAGAKFRKPTAEESKALEKIDWEPAFRNGNRWYDRMAAALRHQGRNDRESALDRFEADLNALRAGLAGKPNIPQLLAGNGPADGMVGKAIGDVLTAQMMPAARKVQAGYDRSEQVRRNLHVAFALAAYQREEGRYPAKLDDLAPKYIPAVPDDLFTGKALIYRPADKGYLLYSVGVNGRDDGGRATEDDPACDDLPVRMPLPELKPQK